MMGTDATILLVVGGIITIVLAPVLAFFGSGVAEMKGRRKVPWLILCGLFFPTLILLCALPPKNAVKASRV
jgi:hypothetical protein